MHRCLHNCVSIPPISAPKWLQNHTRKSFRKSPGKCHQHGTHNYNFWSSQSLKKCSRIDPKTHSCLASLSDSIFSCFGEDHIAFWAYPPMKNKGFQKQHFLSHIVFELQNDSILVSKSIQHGLENQHKVWPETHLEKTGCWIPKWIQNESNIDQKWLQQPPELTYDDPKVAQERPRASQERFGGQNDSTMSQTWPQNDSIML